MQFQADVMRRELVRPENLETTAKGAARAARLGLAPEDCAPVVESSSTFRPTMREGDAERIVARWLAAVEAVDRLYGKGR
jgi:glycerol kinase